MNRAEALEEEAKYLAAGWELTQKHSDANLIVVRGCSVTSHAQRDCEKLIEHLKQKYPNTRVLIQGCLTERTLTPSFIRGLPADPDEVPVPTRTARAYLKVQDGCGGRCAFCIVPKFRGASVSVVPEKVLDKAKRFIDAGYHEIVVTGCNLSLYASQGKRLPELLDDLAALSADCRIRLGSLEPSACALDVVNVVAARANICKFLHVPVQSGSNGILAAMMRPYTVRDVEAIVGTAFKLMPEVGLGCDIITGFPGEGEIDFLATKGLLKRLPFSNAHIFPFSERPGTRAADLGGKIAREIRSARAHQLADIVSVKRKQFAKKFVGREVEVVIENEKTVSGWTSPYLWFEAETASVPASLGLKRKQRVRFRVTETHHDTLKGVPV